MGSGRGGQERASDCSSGEVREVGQALDGSGGTRGRGDRPRDDSDGPQKHHRVQADDPQEEEGDTGNERLGQVVVASRSDGLGARCGDRQEDLGAGDATGYAETEATIGSSRAKWKRRQCWAMREERIRQRAAVKKGEIEVDHNSPDYVLDGDEGNGTYDQLRKWRRRRER